MSALPTTSREWQLVARPHGWPTKDLVALREVPVAEPADGHILVRNTHFSVDPYMRGRMSAAKSYAAPYELDRPMHGGAVGEVIASRAEGFAVGDTVTHGLGWREIAEVPAGEARKIDTSLAPASAYLGVLGMIGLTAYAGLFRVAGFKEGDAVFVSGAAGAVGGLVGQMARLKGASRVIGSAGSDAKVERLLQGYGFDAAFNYKNGPVAAQLAEAAPDGIDVYFDNVGGEHLEAALGAFNDLGRAALCGAISVYNATEPTPGPNNLTLAVTKRLRLQGFIVTDHLDLLPDFVRDTAGWLASGELVHDETVVEGIENGFDAFLGVLRGDNTGKMIVSLTG
ncbi:MULTISPECIES: NADP-dependent oxidoreductase [Streptomyces]|uniref:NADP-dependent oxidoreductase n=1 Tax=Streptomyces tsukubensis (strain DSM 42081 / NBRC 108919 / NRRL 18488 / 9993) TaxID=1114943 RepID=I2MXT8_STRT9|nr:MULTISPECIES: NADP-dependent oxidoreductase [Streptomyces]AZK93945.1 NADP-dependent oxidoreductase [Streptomyces tsukubensis]EIF89585.1 alcohol dehydrogenase [Streptomyces tsukubensis NRRL18488]MYS66140.1 NADP-dependent oxidoreductase [Streptomyces sp. SID5473]QKM69933.1 NADP-dependent oxidoreductase [Streptomyces tsukubensis NRRL18488]TAI46091.1 NADP-dependent oxidoreductase [Streptomyces tsukubensis]